MSEFELFRGTPHPLRFTGERSKVDNTGEFRTTPRAESTGEDKPVAQAMVEFGGLVVPVPIYELSFGKADQMTVRAIGRLAAHQLVVVSRLAERGIVLAGVDEGFAHPAAMVRDSARRIQGAHYAAIPRPVESRGSASRVASQRNFNEVAHVANCMAEEMWFQINGKGMHVDRHETYPWIDVAYDYEPLGQSQEGVTVTSSTVQRITPIPRRVPDNTLLLVHNEAVLEAARTGVDPSVVAKMVFPVGLHRDPAGYQGNTFIGLGYYSTRTLGRYLRDVKI